MTAAGFPQQVGLRLCRLRTGTTDGGFIGSWQLLIILLIAIMLFGSKRPGSDLGTAIRGFRRSVSEEEQPDQPERGNQCQAGIEKAARVGGFVFTAREMSLAMGSARSNHAT